MYLTPKYNGYPGLGASITPHDLSSTGQKFEFVPNDGVALDEISFTCTNAMSGTAAVISVYSRPVPTIAGSDTLLGTLTIPTGTAAGAVIARKVSETSWGVKQGQSLVFSCTTAASSGKGLVSFKASQVPEDIKNVSSSTLVTG